jgi:hypothetical protein
MNITKTPITVQTSASSRFDRWAGACWVGAGLLLLIGVFHPDVSETTFSDAALDTHLSGCRCTPPLSSPSSSRCSGSSDCTRGAPTAWVGWGRLGLRSPSRAS